MCLDDVAIRRHLAVSREAAVRQRAFEFLRWARDDLGLCPKSGDDVWGAIDVLNGDRVVARVFPKGAAKLKVANVGKWPADRYGTAVSLTGNAEWSFDLTSPRFDLQIAQRCLADQKA